MRYSVTIQAPREIVWKRLWDKASYTKWTEPFSPGSQADTDWKKNSRVIFHDGSGSGMLSQIAEIIPNEFMSFKHLGIMKEGKEDTQSDEAKKWSGMLENYTLTDKNGDTEVVMEMVGFELPPEHKEYLEAAWPKALAILKEISEADA